MRNRLNITRAANSLCSQDSMTSTTRHRRRLIQVACMVALFGLFGCHSTSSDQTAWLNRGATILAGNANAAVPQAIYMDPAVWIEDSPSIEIANDRLPEWAVDDFEVCVHWHAQYSREELNQNRSRGEPTRWQITGDAQGWILLSADDHHILELSLTEQGGEAPATITVINAWDAP
jgi:hypothetical protein